MAGFKQDNRTWPPCPDLPAPAIRQTSKQFLISGPADLLIGFFGGCILNFAPILGWETLVVALRHQESPERKHLMFTNAPQVFVEWLLVLIMNFVLNRLIHDFPFLFWAFRASFWIMTVFLMSEVFFPGG